MTTTASDPEGALGTEARPLPPMVWPTRDMRARVDIDDRDAVQDILDREAGHR